MVMMKVLCVLRSGGVYRPEHVEVLRESCRLHLPEHEFCCLTDRPGDVAGAVPLVHGWPGWFSKFEMFRIPGPCLYLDLDTVLLRDCRSWVRLLRGRRFVALRDFYRGRRDAAAIQSALMYWEGDVSYLYRAYLANPRGHRRGDQGVLEEEVVGDVHKIQDITGEVVSFKVERAAGRGFDDASLVCFHGRPRPWEQNVLPYEIHYTN
jgi:hypothetical protein